MGDLAQTVASIADPLFWVATIFTLASGVMRGFIGMGSGMLMAPVFAILFGPLETVVMVMVLELAISIQLVPTIYRQIEWSTVTTLFVGSAIFMPLGSWLLMSVEETIMARLISGVVLLFVILLFVGYSYSGTRRSVTTLGVGALSGTLMGATSLGGPPVMLYLLSGPDSPTTNRANFISFFALTLLLLLGLMLINGLLVKAAVLRSIVLLPPFMLGTWVGSKYFRQANEKIYRQAAFGLLLCVALFGLLR